jgi:hypothetical protein
MFPAAISETQTRFRTFFNSQWLAMATMASVQMRETPPEYRRKATTMPLLLLGLGALVLLRTAWPR